MLKRMARRVNRAQTEALLDTLRRQIPHLALRTTFITGFPGETEDQFQELLEFVQQQRFERLGVFTYSYETSTPSAQLPGHLDERIKEERRARLMQVQQDNAFAWNANQIGRQMDVILDAAVPDQPQAWIGRSYADAPDVDGLVWVTGEDLALGDIVPTEIVATKDYDLIAAAL